MIATGSHRVGTESGSLLVKTYREGVAAKAGHDLVIEVTTWHATVSVTTDPSAWSVEFSADARSFQVREGLRGIKPLTDKDRGEIRKTIDEKVLRGQPIEFRSSVVRLLDGDRRLLVEGDLTMAGSTRRVSAQLDVDAEGRITGTVPLTQSDWGIKPYRGLMGTLKVRDEVEVVIDARVPAG